MHLQQTATCTGELQEESCVFWSDNQELIDRTRISSSKGRMIKETCDSTPYTCTRVLQKSREYRIQMIRDKM